MTRAKPIKGRRAAAMSLNGLLSHPLDEGLAAIEFALVVPVFLLILVGAVDLGGMLYTSYQLETAVAAGAEYAALNGSNVNSTSGATLASSIAGVVENANGATWANDSVVVNDGPSVTVTAGVVSSGGTASNANSCYCPTGSPPNWVWGSAATCNSICATGGQAQQFVMITATRAYTPLLSTFGLIKNGTLSQNATVEVP
ncbi:MAG TPA: TadE/TadG family type IV pilus assembly protein [Rhizomicrobium sp.]